MTDDPVSDEARALERAFAELPEPELPAELARRLRAIPEQASVRRFPGRAWRASAFGWAAAAAVGLFIGTQSVDTAYESASLEDETSLASEASADDEDETLLLAIGSFTELEEP